MASEKVLKYQKKFHINIGFVIILIILIYIIFHIFSFLTKKDLSIYEVKIGQIAHNNHYEAFAIRQETVCNAEMDGYPYYYALNQSRVGMQTNIYAMDQSGELYKKLTDADINIDNISKENLIRFADLISNYKSNYNNINFQNTYSFKSDLDDQVEGIYHQEAEKSLQDEIQNALSSGTYSIYGPPMTGFLIYTLDGYEGTNLENYKEVLSGGNQEKIQDLRTDEKLSAQSPVYKLITSDDWQLVMKISDSVYDEIKERKYINIRFDYDGSTTSAAVSFDENGDDKYLILSLDDSMERFANQRFIPVELLINQEKGLKIPNSAIINKDFYALPKDCFFYGNNSSSIGLTVKGKDGEADSFVPLQIYYADEENYYVDPDDLKESTDIIIPDSVETVKLSDHITKLTGVYNVNRGFAVFNPVEILYKTEDYSIVNKASAYGITQYDHIALNGKQVRNGQIIY